jgi:hypothetical protein
MIDGDDWGALGGMNVKGNGSTKKNPVDLYTARTT